MEDYIRISKEQFYNYFKYENYNLVRWHNWNNKKFPKPPYWQAHLNWVFDETTNRYVGYESSSSWNDDVEYTILKELCTPEMIEWNTNYLAKKKLKDDQFEKEYKEFRSKHPRKPFDPAKPGLFEHLAKENTIAYSPSTESLDDIVKALDDMWKDAFTAKGTFFGLTGREGAIKLNAEFIIQGKEKFGEKSLTEDEKKIIREEVENSHIWEDGMYEIGGEEPVKYIGLEDMDQPDGTFVTKDSRGVWRVEEWKGHWRTNYRVITKEEARKLIEDNDGKLIEK